MPVTLYDKLWDEHLVQTDENNESLIYIDRHYLHEVTSPQAFEGLRISEKEKEDILAQIETATDGLQKEVDDIQLGISESGS